jgi:hypothetical protein
MQWQHLGPKIPVPVWFSTLWRARGLDDPDQGIRWSELKAQDWSELDAAKGRTLLLVHGTGQRTVPGFLGLTREEYEHLHTVYGGRILAFEHRALAHHLDRNARELARALERGGVPLELDVLGLSRGGLVTRMLVEGWEPLREDIEIRRLVMLGTPNDGTPSARRDTGSHASRVMKDWRHDVRRLALTSHTERAIERHPDPFSIPTFDPGAFGKTSWPFLCGSQDQIPGSPMLGRLNGFAGLAPFAARETTYFALASLFSFDFGAPNPILNTLRRTEVLEHAMTTVPNDLVVPTASVFKPVQGPHASGFFPLVPERLVVLTAAANATHVGLFRLAAVRRQLIEWLTGSTP